MCDHVRLRFCGAQTVDLRVDDCDNRGTQISPYVAVGTTLTGQLNVSANPGPPPRSNALF
jgi:hypothetical protein